MMQHWEYQEITIKPNRSSLADHANELGRQGWELIAIRPDPQLPGAERAVFKRPVHPGQAMP